MDCVSPVWWALISGDPHFWCGWLVIYISRSLMIRRMYDCTWQVWADWLWDSGVDRWCWLHALLTTQKQAVSSSSSAVSSTTYCKRRHVPFLHLLRIITPLFVADADILDTLIIIVSVRAFVTGLRPSDTAILSLAAARIQVHAGAGDCSGRSDWILLGRGSSRKATPADTGRRASAGLMLAQRLRRWSNISPALDHRHRVCRHQQHQHCMLNVTYSTSVYENHEK